MLHRFNFSQLVPHLATLGALILLLSLGYQAYITLQNTEMMTAETEELNDPKEQQKRIESNMVDYAIISQWHLFGKIAESVPTVISAVSLSAPETRLKLRLIGIFLDSKENQGFAIISKKGKPQISYHVGDVINKNTRLFSVQADHVILQRNDRHEKLSMKKRTLNVKSN